MQGGSGMSEHIVENNPKKEFMFALGGVGLFLAIVLLIGVSGFLRPAGEHITAKPAEEEAPVATAAAPAASTDAAAEPAATEAMPAAEAAPTADKAATPAAEADATDKAATPAVSADSTAKAEETVEPVEADKAATAK